MANPICAEGCEGNLPVVSFSECAPEINFSEIQAIYVGKGNTQPFTNWTQPAEWTARMSQNSVVGNDYIRKLTVIADMPAATSTPKEISKGRTIVVDKTRVINVTIDETNSINYEFLRGLECGQQVTIWFETKGGLMFGGNSGIKVSTNMDPVFARGGEEILLFNGTFTWKSKFSPERTTSPVFGIEGPTTAVVYDTELVFPEDPEDLTDTEAGVTGTVEAGDDDLKFEFQAIDPRVGTPMSMTVKIGGVEVMVIDFVSDYLGQPFKLTDADGGVRNGIFTNGDYNF